ncbi:hypothetical protein MPTP_1412 [Melissococcus plutonius ATCC 35311]|uniref:Uncharacterized protein n=1 Tax=Melissococcus plutonius (strain ATCC 35311 / DSM 29964 / CIP 104052 / LMG 20360 / NCIMB 702443) TaxID=940190 RepID=F3YBG3_MELPT|nr:hypothetical protein [Melissococcus plutonius]BAK21841.1 hypothetical protein MPTP_1412 [Melissococcus plutonius ATCC 35311]BBD15604.1 hypothetical protein DAT585_1307 [Melissococcus plutonius]
MAVQCDYLHLAGVSIQEAISQAPTSISIGGTHLELPNSVSSTVGSTMVCVEAYRLLSRTGLLYRGVGSK